MKRQSGDSDGTDTEEECEDSWRGRKQGRENVIRGHVSDPFLDFCVDHAKKYGTPKFIFRYTTFT